jgi:peptidoglycan/xylan/chitin deacetylase (PgdA/CDA1 family)
MLALCIDDGSDMSMHYILDQLAAAKAPANFFQVGRHVGKSAERLAFARRALSEGHAIEHHTWRQDDASQLAAAAIRDDLDRARAQHRRLFRRELRYFRPPRGHVDAVLLGVRACRRRPAGRACESRYDGGHVDVFRVRLRQRKPRHHLGGLPSGHGEIPARSARSD